MTDAAPILELDSVSKEFAAVTGLFGASLLSRHRTVIRAVADVSLAVARNEVVGLVGESGCGKSTLGRIAAGLIPPSRGAVRVDGEAKGPGRARRIQMIFQNPLSSLNPRQTVRQIIEEPLRVHRIVPRSEVGRHADDLLRQVGLDDGFADRRPHQLSGGQSQRVGIARALSVAPNIIVCDEPTSALDVSIQAQVLNLFADLRERLAVSYLFISHDLGVVERLSDRVAVMYLGRIVESAPTAILFGEPKHPYTQMLLASVPRIGRRKRTAVVVSGERPSPLRPPAGCAFHPRCPQATARCRIERPLPRVVPDGGSVACHLY